MNLNLKVAILASGEAQWEIARRAAIAETKLSKVIRGRVELSEDERRRLSDVLGIPAADLFGSPQPQRSVT